MPARFDIAKRGDHGTYTAVWLTENEVVQPAQAAQATALGPAGLPPEMVKSAWDNGPMAVILVLVLVGFYKIALAMKDGFVQSMDKLNGTLDRLGDRLGAADVRIESGVAAGNKEIVAALHSAGPIASKVATDTGNSVVERLTEVVKYEGQKTRSLLRGEAPSEMPRSGRRPDSDD